VLLVPNESLVLPTTTATIAGSVAVYELLFREVVELACFDGVLGLHGSVG